MSSGRKLFLIGLLLFGLVFLVFLPATRNGFSNYDDTLYVTENPRVQSGPTWANLKWGLTTGHAGNWHPLTWWSHMTDCRLYGAKPSGHHLTSVLLHALNAALLFLALQRMTGATGRSLAVAVLFGVHPLRVESVAWIAERKDVLSGLFFMLMLLAYRSYVARKTWKPYALSLVFFGLGLMSKPMLVTSPFVLLLLDYWPLKRFAVHGPPFTPSASPQSAAAGRLSQLAPLLLEKVPFFLLAAVSSVVTFEVQRSGEAVVNSLPLIARVENAVVSYGRYLGHLFWPADLAVYYPHPKSWPLTIILACAVALAVVSFLAVSWSRRLPYLFLGWFWYLGALVPVIGLVQVGTQSMADRYTYLPMIGILWMMVWGVHELAGRTRRFEIALSAAGAAAMLACAALTLRQIGCWRNSETLFRHALAVTSENSVALDNLGRALGENGRLDEAMDQYRAAIRLNANDPFAHNGLGVVLMKKRDYDGAAAQLQEALRLDPKNAVAHYNLGIILAHNGSLDEAISHCKDAVRLRPDYAEAHNNLGGGLAMKGRYDDAIPHYRDALRLKPGHALTHKNLGVALAETGRLDEAIEEFREAVRLQPEFAEARQKLRMALEAKTGTGSPDKPVSKR